MRRLLFALPLFALAIGNTTATADPKNPTYDDDVVAIFKQHCTSCHGNDKQKSDLNLATYAALKQGGSSGEIMVPGDPDKSRLVALTAHKEEPKMPPNKDRIPDAQVNLLKLWIEQGGRENSGSKAIIPKKTAEIGLASVVKGRPEGPPPMPVLGKLPLDPVVVARRPGSILALAASPWAPVVAVGGQKQVLLYNTDTAQLVGVIPFEHGQINCIKFSRNAQYLLVAGGVGGQSGKAVLHEIKTGKKIVEVGIESDAILAADISADQTQIAVGSPSKLVRIYSTKDGSVLREIKKHTDWVTAVEFSPDGVLLATGDRNGGLFAWEAFTGREFFSLRGHTGMISDLSWRDDSNVLASSSEDGSVKLWSMQNGNGIKSWGAHNGGAAAVRFTHDNKLATTGRDKVTKLWDQDGKVQKQFEAFPDLGLSVAVTHDNAKVIAGDWSGVVKAFNAADAKVIAEFDANPPPLTDRVKNAEAAIPTADAKVLEAKKALDAATARAKQAADAHTAAQAKLNKINADLAVAKKAIEEQTKAAATAKAAVDAAKKDVDKAASAAKAATEKAAAIEAKLKVAKAADVLAAFKKDLDTAKKASADAAKALKAATDKHAAANKTYTDATTAAANARKQVAALTPMVKPATDAITPAKKAADDAAKPIAAAKTALDAAAADAAAARKRLDLLKTVAALPQPKEKK
jgi:hypothetical protein